jgi:hypothetical protein
MAPFFQASCVSCTRENPSRGTNYFEDLALKNPVLLIMLISTAALSGLTYNVRGQDEPVSPLPLNQPESVTADNQLGNSGRVLEVIDSGIHTYLKVTTDADPLWLAVYKTDIPKGATIRYPTGILMSNFYNESLKRTFKLIVFVDRVKRVE